MKNRHLPDWLLILLGLSTYTPRGLAARYAESAHRSLVLKPRFADVTPAPAVQPAASADESSSSSEAPDAVQPAAAPASADPSRRAA